MRILVDYRPALRERTGVGEYVHQMVRAYTSLSAAGSDEVRLFTSSWKDRPAPGLAEELQASVVDRRVPVKVLNYAWHRLGVPPVEWLAGAADVVHSAHPLLIPARKAAQVITIHDLFFLDAPERTRAEIRRDYASLAPAHARRAHAILTASHYTAARIERDLGIAPERIYVCPPGRPTWEGSVAEGAWREGDVIFVGTLEPRKNIGALLEAYKILLAQGKQPPVLRLIGGATPEAAAWLDEIAKPPLAGTVVHNGYVGTDERERLFREARMLVLPSFDEGFGLPVLEAMSAGVPVIASNRGSLPEVLGGAGMLIEPEDHEGLAASILLLLDREVATGLAKRGLARAQEFSWGRTAATIRQMYLDAFERRQTDL